MVAASLLAKVDISQEDQGMLLVVSKNRLNESMEKIVSLCKEKNLPHQPLAGIIITGDGRVDEKIGTFSHEDFIFENKIPLITTPLDTYGTAVQISRLEVKINIQTMGKANRAVELIRENVDLDKIKWG